MTNSPRALRTGIMLAHPATERRVAKLGPVCIVQPKLRGVRARVSWVDDKPIFWSAQANLIHFTQLIEDEMKRRPRLNYDGELYLHGWSQEKINSAILREKEPNGDTPFIQYHVFDIINDKPQHERFAQLESVFKAAPPTKRFRLVWTEAIHTIEWQRKALEFFEQGFEGIILRGVSDPYCPTTGYNRSSGLLKFKPTESDEYPIIDVLEGEGQFQDAVGAFVVRDAEGNTFRVGSGRALTNEERFRLWPMRADLIGCNLLVKHEKIKLDSGKPLCAVALEVVGRKEG